MKTNWAVIAENSAIDRDTNNISLFNVIEEVHIPEPPEPRDDGDQLSVVALRFVFVALFARSEAGTGEKKEVRLTIALPDGKVAETGLTFEIDLDTADRTRIRINGSTLPLAGKGEYRFRIEGRDEDADWHLITEVPLQVGYLAE